MPLKLGQFISSGEPNTGFSPEQLKMNVLYVDGIFKFHYGVVFLWSWSNCKIEKLINNIINIILNIINHIFNVNFIV